MSKRTIVIIILALFTFIFLVQVLNYHIYNDVRHLEISLESSSEPSGSMRSFNVSSGVGVFPESWQLAFKLSIWNNNPTDCLMEQADYTVSLGETEVSQGQFKNINLPKQTMTALPDIPLTLLMSEIAETSPELISSALENRGNITFDISVNVKTPTLLLGLLRIGTAEKSDDFVEPVHIVDTISVSSLNWHGERRLVKECHPGEDMLGEFRISRVGGIAESLEAKITEVSSDGKETIVAVQELEGELSPYSRMFNFSWHVPDSLPMNCVGFSVHLLYGGTEIWSSRIDPPSLQLVRRYTLNEALEEEYIDLAIRGTGYCAGDAIDLEIEVNLEVSIDLEVEAGTVLINSGSGQNMIVAETTTLRVEPKLEIELSIESYCLDLHKDNPRSNETFIIALGSAGYSEDAIRLMQSLEDAPSEHQSLSGVQIALWAIIENPSRSEVSQVFTVSESSLEDAAWLLQNIGLDPNQKRLFTEG